MNVIVAFLLLATGGTIGGDQPEFVQYREVHAGAPRVMLIDAGQDTPLFDEESLRSLPAKK